MINYVRKCEGNTTMSFKINGSKLLSKYNQIWKKKNEKLLRMKFDSKPVHGENDKYIPTKIKYMLIVCIKPLKVKKMPKEKVSFKYLSIIILYSVVKVKKKKKRFWRIANMNQTR